MNAANVPWAPVGVDELTTIAADVWEAFLAGDGVTSHEGTRAPVDGEGVVHASVGVHGGWIGQVVLEVSAIGAADLARRMLGSDDVAAADVTDVVGELVNVVGGNVKSLVSSDTTLGLPMVVEGAVARSGAHDAVETCGVQVEWAGHGVRLSVWTKAQSNENREVES